MKRFCRFERRDWTSITVAQCATAKGDGSRSRCNSSHRSNIFYDIYNSKMKFIQLRPVYSLNCPHPLSPALPSPFPSLSMEHQALNLIPRCHRGLRSGCNGCYVAIIGHDRVAGRGRLRCWHHRVGARRHIGGLRGSYFDRGLPGSAGRPSGRSLRRRSLGTCWHSRATARRNSSGEPRAHRDRGLPGRAAAQSTISVLR